MVDLQISFSLIKYTVLPPHLLSHSQTELKKKLINNEEIILKWDRKRIVGSLESIFEKIGR